MSNLLPCPFCGSADVGGAVGQVHCRKCPATIKVQNTNTHYAGELWNTRTQHGDAKPYGWITEDGQFTKVPVKVFVESSRWKPLYEHPPTAQQQGEAVGYCCHNCGYATSPPEAFKFYVECHRCGKMTSATIARNLAENCSNHPPADNSTVRVPVVTEEMINAAAEVFANFKSDKLEDIAPAMFLAMLKAAQGEG